MRHIRMTSLTDATEFELFAIQSIECVNALAEASDNSAIDFTHGHGYIYRQKTRNAC